MLPETPPLLLSARPFPRPPLQLPLRTPYLVILEVRLQRDAGQRWGRDQLWGGVLGQHLQGSQQDKAQTQRTEGHGFWADKLQAAAEGGASVEAACAPYLWSALPRAHPGVGWSSLCQMQER